MFTLLTEAQLRAHVTMLAGSIGERHVLRPRALAAAADYITAEWRAQGYAPEVGGDVVGGHNCAHPIAGSPGRTLGGVLLIGGDYEKGGGGARGGGKTQGGGRVVA